MRTHVDSTREVPSSSTSADGAVHDVLRATRRSILVRHLRRLSIVAVCVTTTLAGVSLYFTKVGRTRCRDALGASICTHQRWHPLSVQRASLLETKDGVPHGRRIEWFSSGVKQIEGRYEDGVKQGPWSEGYASGEPMFIGNYEDGVLVGKETWFYENGNREWEVEHDRDGVGRGQRDGGERWWFASGVLRREGRYDAGQKDGTFIVYNEDGREAFRAFYEDGVARDGRALD